MELGLGLGLAGLMLCCESRSCYARRHNDLEGHNLSSIVYSFCILCLGHHYWEDRQWVAVAFIYSKVKFVKCLCLLPVVLVLLFWSWSLVLDLQAAVVVLVFDPWSKNLVLFTSLM